MLLAILIWCAFPRLAQSYTFNCTILSPSKIINSSADALALAQQCQNAETDVDIGVTASGDLDFTGILNSIESLHVDNVPQVSNISSNSLETMNGGLDVTNVPSLTGLSFPRLGSITGWSSFTIANAPLLSRYDVAGNATYNTKTWNTSISNTALKDWEMSFTLDAKDELSEAVPTTSDTFIWNNPNLKTVRLLMTRVTGNYPGAPTGNLYITNNSRTMSVSMPNLISTYGSFIIGGFAELSIPSLELVNGSLVLTSANLPSISAPNLTKVNGNLYVTGNFTSLLFPALGRVNGDFHVESSNVLDCSPWRRFSGDNYVGGAFFCGGASASGSGAATTSRTASGMSPSRTGSHPPSPGGISATAKDGIIAGTVVGGVLVLSAIITFRLLQRRRKARNAPASNLQINEKLGPVELPQGRQYERSEFVSMTNQVSEVRGSERYKDYPPIQSSPVTAFPIQPELP